MNAGKESARFLSLLKKRASVQRTKTADILAHEREP